MLARTQETQKFWKRLAAILILCTFAQLSFSTQCTPETCPDSPVYVEFMNRDCSGAREYYSFDGVKWNECQESDDYYAIRSYTDTYLEYAGYRSPFCGAGLEYPWKEVIHRHFGVCFDESGDFANTHAKFGLVRPLTKRNSAGGPRGFMYLRNAKQHFSPQVPIFNDSQPYLPGATYACKSYQDCASKGFYIRQHSEHGCNNAPTSFTYLNATANTCYNSFQGLVTYSCSNKHTLRATFSRNGDCSLPYMTYYYGSDCGVRTQETVYCTAMGG